MTPIYQLKSRERGDCKSEKNRAVLQNQLNKKRKHPPGAQARPKNVFHSSSWGERERDPHDEVYGNYFCLSVGTFTFRIYSCSNSTITHTQNLCAIFFSATCACGVNACANLFVHFCVTKVGLGNKNCCVSVQTFSHTLCVRVATRLSTCVCRSSTSTRCMGCI